MKLAILCCAMAMCVAGMAQAYPCTLTFDDMSGHVANYYMGAYGISFSSGFSAVDHSGSTWGPPRSGSNVLIWAYPGYNSNSYGMGFKKYGPWPQPSYPLYAHSVGGYFSTEMGVVLEMRAYQFSLYDEPVASALIGASGESWASVYVQIGSLQTIGMVEFVPVTADALSHFSADDITVDFVPEPSSLLALVAGLGGLGGMVWRWRR